MNIRCTSGREQGTENRVENKTDASPALTERMVAGEDGTEPSSTGLQNRAPGACLGGFKGRVLNSCPY